MIFKTGRRHPEQKDNEIFLMNLRDGETFDSDLGGAYIKSTRLGDVAYQTNSDIVVPNFKPLFGTVKKTVYNREIHPGGKLFSMEEFIIMVDNGYFIDSDGYGAPSNSIKTTAWKITPSQIHNQPMDITHIVWYKTF